MKANKITAIGLTVAFTIGVPFSGYTYADECYLDRRMEDVLYSINSSEQEIISRGVEEPTQSSVGSIDVKGGSCLPALDAFDALMRMRIPSVGGMLGGLFNAIKSMVCSFANNFISQQINSFDMSYGDPYGIISIGVGGTTHGNGGFTNESYDIGDLVQGAAVDAIGGAIKGKIDGIGGFGSGVSGPKDRIPRIENTINDGVRDAFKGL